MFGRRVPPHIVFVLSALCALLCAVPAARYALAANLLPALLWGAASLWFAVDAARAYRWRQPKKS